MTNTTTFRVIIAVSFVAASLFFVSGVRATTENECLIGGGHVSSGSGCSFCVGGKYDLTEITQTNRPAKEDTGRSGTDQKTNAASQGQPGKKTVATSPSGN